MRDDLYKFTRVFSDLQSIKSMRLSLWQSLKAMRFVDARYASGKTAAKEAKVKNDWKTGRIRVKKKREGKNEDLNHVELSNTIYKIHAYFIHRATNDHNNSKCNNIFFLIWVLSHVLNLYSRKMIIMKFIPLGAG